MKIIMYTDGGSRGNPGIAGSGTVIYAEDGTTVLKEIAYVVGKKSTNNVAEYHGLLRGLEAALEMNATDVTVFMDSKLVVEQITGRWKIKHPDMQKLALKAQTMIKQLDSFQISWVARAKNKVADALSNVAMDACKAGHPVGIIARDEPVRDEPVQDEAARGEPARDEAVQDEAAQDKFAAENKTSRSNDDWMGTRANSVTMFLLRHGETEFNANHKCIGATDAPLTSHGKAQAEAAARYLSSHKIDAVVSSPLKRCVETAQALGTEVEVLEDLRELDFGQWEGLSVKQAVARDPELYEQWRADSTVATPDGESLLQLHRRVRSVRAQLQKRFAGKTIVVVSHVHPIKSFLRQALDAGPVSVQRMHLDVASISEVEFYDGGALVRGMNSTAHLR